MPGSASIAFFELLIRPHFRSKGIGLYRPASKNVHGPRNLRLRHLEHGPQSLPACKALGQIVGFQSFGSSWNRSLGFFVVRHVTSGLTPRLQMGGVGAFAYLWPSLPNLTLIRLSKTHPACPTKPCLNPSRQCRVQPCLPHRDATGPNYCLTGRYHTVPATLMPPPKLTRYCLTTPNRKKPDRNRACHT